jgi:hypothetical protein
VARDLSKGLHSYRHKSNPRERVASEMWAKNLSVLEYLLGDGQDRVCPTDREWAVAATLMQWLGSPVGLGYLGDLREAWQKAGLK